MRSKFLSDSPFPNNDSKFLGHPSVSDTNQRVPQSLELAEPALLKVLSHNSTSERNPSPLPERRDRKNPLNWEQKFNSVLVNLPKSLTELWRPAQPDEARTRPEPDEARTQAQPDEVQIQTQAELQPQAVPQTQAQTQPDEVKANYNEAQVKIDEAQVEFDEAQVKPDEVQVQVQPEPLAEFQAELQTQVESQTQTQTQPDEAQTQHFKRQAQSDKVLPETESLESEKTLSEGTYVEGSKLYHFDGTSYVEYQLFDLNTLGPHKFYDGKFYLCTKKQEMAEDELKQAFPKRFASSSECLFTEIFDNASGVQAGPTDKGAFSAGSPCDAPIHAPSESPSDAISVAPSDSPSDSPSDALSDASSGGKFSTVGVTPATTLAGITITPGTTAVKELKPTVNDYMADDMSFCEELVLPNREMNSPYELALRKKLWRRFNISDEDVSALGENNVNYFPEVGSGHEEQILCDSKEISEVSDKKLIANGSNDKDLIETDQEEESTCGNQQTTEDSGNKFFENDSIRRKSNKDGEDTSKFTISNPETMFLPLISIYSEYLFTRQLPKLVNSANNPEDIPVDYRFGELDLRRYMKHHNGVNWEYRFKDGWIEERPISDKEKQIILDSIPSSIPDAPKRRFHLHKHGHKKRIGSSKDNFKKSIDEIFGRRSGKLKANVTSEIQQKSASSSCSDLPTILDSTTTDTSSGDKNSCSESEAFGSKKSSSFKQTFLFKMKPFSKPKVQTDEANYKAGLRHCLKIRSRK